jgi:prepilin-type N-terminal cleavage/methylation domain-containing protein
MRERAHKNNGLQLKAGVSAQGGFSLVEIMVSLMILAIGMLGSFVGIMSALDHGLMNEMRNDAMKIAQQQVEAARNMPYANIASIPAVQNITRQVRKTSVTYQVNFPLPTVAINQNPMGQAGDAMSLLQFTVTWTHKSPMDTSPRQYSYSLQTIVRQTK